MDYTCGNNWYCNGIIILKIMKSIYSFIASFTSFLLPVQGVLIAVAIAIFLDTVTGLYKASKLKKPIRSRYMSDIVGKLIIYEACVILLFIIDHYLLSEFMKIWFSVDYFFTKLIALVLVGIELTSIKENYEEATGKDVIKWLKSTLKRSREIKNDINDLI